MCVQISFFKKYGLAFVSFCEGGFSKKYRLAFKSFVREVTVSVFCKLKIKIIL
jgi:hypothetical protein